MRTLGIPVPPGMRALYAGKDTVVLGEQEFQKAFREIYYPTLMDQELFRWG